MTKLGLVLGGAGANVGGAVTERLTTVCDQVVVVDRVARLSLGLQAPG